MRKSTAALLYLLFLAIPASASEIIFQRDYVVPRPFGGSETVKVKLQARNDAIVARVALGNSDVMFVYTKTDTAITISKYEESGGYAHGITYWVNDGDGVHILYAYSHNGSVDLPAFKANTTLKIQLYRIDVFFREYIDPQYWFVTSKDSTGPTFTLTPAPGAYASATVTAAPRDAGVGMAPDLDMVTEYTVRRASTGEIVASGSGTRVPLEEEGPYDLSFTAADLLGNRGNSPPAAGNPNTYTIDHSPPDLSDVAASAQPRKDGSLDLSLQFVLSDQGVGVALPSLAVQVSDADVLSWSFGAGDLVIVSGTGGSIAVSLPVLVVPRSTRLVLHVVVEDTIGNTLDNDDHSLAMPPDALGASVLSSGVTAEVVQNGSVLVSRYRIPIALDRPRGDLLSAGVARYRLTRRIEPSGIVEAAADLAPDEFVSRLVDQDGRAVFSDVVEGSGYAHRSLAYEIETVFSVTGSETAQVTGVAEMPNIEAWQVDLSAGETSLQVYRSGVSQYPELRIRSFEGVMARIGPDPEGDVLAMRLEYLGPDGISGSVPAEDWTQQVILTDAIPGAPDGVYQIRYIVHEAGNTRLQTSPWCVINVDRNYGEITGDVEWATDQVMSGSIVILGGARLRIAGGVRITVVRAIDPVTGGALTITVRPGGTLELAPGSVVQPMDWKAGEQAGNGWEYWGGIMAEGVVSVISGTIRGAIRGVTATSGSSVTLQGASIEQCRTGVHAIGDGADPAIDGTRFIGSARYGIKEDAGASPVVTNCVFDSNTYDYYDEVLTVVDAVGINALPPGSNSGNESSGASP